MSHPIPGHHYDEDLEAQLEQLPDLCADALEMWRIKTLDREKTEALLYATYKGMDQGRTATEIKYLVQADSGRYDSVLAEIKAEATYQRLYERLMCQKKIAQMRVAI